MMLTPRLLSLAVALLAIPASAQLVPDSPKRVEPVTFPGTVFRFSDNAPLEGAEVVVRRVIEGTVTSEPGGDADDAIPAGELTTLRTDARGRFTLTFTPEQVSEPRLVFKFVRVSYPGYVPRTSSSAYSLANVIRLHALGDTPSFMKIGLEPGVEYHGRALTPEGGPAADVPVKFNLNGPWTPSNDFQLIMTTRTDAAGRFRICLPKTTYVRVSLGPRRYAPFLKDWLANGQGQPPAAAVPADLGDLTMTWGPGPTGRLVGLDGKPVAGERLMLSGRYNQVVRAATTDRQGAFVFPPVRPGNYDVFAHGQSYQSLGPDRMYRPTPVSEVVGPEMFFLKGGEVPVPLTLKALPSARVDVSVVDSGGKPVPGAVVRLSGNLTPREVKVAQEPAGFALPRVAAKGVVAQNRPAEEVEDQNTNRFWMAEATSDTRGVASLRAPKGLMNANLALDPTRPEFRYKVRSKPGEEWNHWGGAQLGTIDADRADVTALRLRSPVVLATVRLDDGGPADETQANVNGRFRIGKIENGVGASLQADGRFRFDQLLPDIPYEFAAYSNLGYVTNTVRRLTLKEGEVAEVTLVLRKTPEPLQVGDLARDFLVKTLDGAVVSLDDLRGKPALIHFYNAYNTNATAEFDVLKPIYEKYGKTGRIQMLGLSPANDADDMRRVVKDKSVAWPQALLRDRWIDPIVIDYHGNVVTKFFLLDAKGKILHIAMENSGLLGAIENAVSARPERRPTPAAGAVPAPEEEFLLDAPPMEQPKAQRNLKP